MENLTICDKDTQLPLIQSEAILLVKLKPKYGVLLSLEL